MFLLLMYPSSSLPLYSQGSSNTHSLVIRVRNFVCCTPTENDR